MICLYNGLLLKKNFKTMSLKSIEQKEVDTKGYIVYNFIYMKSYEEPEISAMVEIRLVFI